VTVIEFNVSYSDDDDDDDDDDDIKPSYAYISIIRDPLRTSMIDSKIYVKKWMYNVNVSSHFMLVIPTSYALK